MKIEAREVWKWIHYHHPSNSKLRKVKVLIYIASLYPSHFTSLIILRWSSFDNEFPFILMQTNRPLVVVPIPHFLGICPTIDERQGEHTPNPKVRYLSWIHEQINSSVWEIHAQNPHSQTTPTMLDSETSDQQSGSRPNHVKVTVEVWFHFTNSKAKDEMTSLRNHRVHLETLIYLK